MNSSRKNYNPSEKILLVLYAIKSCYELTSKGQPILVHPENGVLGTFHIVELHSILLKLANEYKVIKILKYSSLSPRYNSMFGKLLQMNTTENAMNLRTGNIKLMSK
jgi:hypothetical protein